MLCHLWGHAGAIGGRGGDLAAEHSPHEAQHGGSQDGKHPGVHDGVDGQEAQSQQVPLVVRLFPQEFVHVGADLSKEGGG